MQNLLSEDIYESFNENKLLFGKIYFPHYFRKASPDFHIDIIRECGSNLYVAIHAPRGSAKSTAETFLDTVHGIVMKRERFIILVQNTYAKAAGTLNNIKFEFKYNEKLRRDFGIDLDLKDAEGDTIFRHSDGYAVRVLCKGADQLGSIRGERFGAYRPTLVMVDDLEDDEMVKNPERRIELEKQFNEVLNYAGDTDTRIIVIGTVLHDDSLLAKLLMKDRYKRFKKIFIQAIKDGNSIWPQKWSMEDLRYMESEDPVGFAKEMMGDPSSGSMETILREDFRYWTVIDNQAVLYGTQSQVVGKWKLTDCKAAIAVDMAWEDKKASDFSAIFPGFVTPSNDLLFDNYVVKRGLRPDELENILFDMDSRYTAMTGKRVQIGFEKAKLEKVMKWFLSEAQKRRNKWLWLSDINWGTKDKIERILSRLGNRYSQHAVYHRRGMGELENQLVRLKSVAHDDLADAAAMLPEMLSFASAIKKVKQPEDKFKFLQKQTVESKHKEKIDKPFVFGRNEKPAPFKTLTALPW